LSGIVGGVKEGWWSIKAWFHSTWFWRVFGICAMRKGYTKFAVAIVLMTGFWEIYTAVDLLNYPVKPREELTVTEGVLVAYTVPVRSLHRQRIHIRKGNGEEITFWGSIYYSDRFRGAKGKRVKVWSRKRIKAWFPFYYDEFMHVQQGNKVLAEYSRDTYQRLVSWEFKDRAVISFLTKLNGVCILIVLIGCRREILSRNK